MTDHAELRRLVDVDLESLKKFQVKMSEPEAAIVIGEAMKAILALLDENDRLRATANHYKTVNLNVGEFRELELAERTRLRDRIATLKGRLQAALNILETLTNERAPKHRTGQLMPKRDRRECIARAVLFSGRSALKGDE